VDQCFQVVYTDATMRFFDHNLMEGAVSSVSVDYSFTGNNTFLFSLINPLMPTVPI